MRKSLLFFAVMLMSAMTYAQVSVTGTVKDASGESMPGVNVIAVGTSVGTSTDFDGNFEIEAPAEAQGIEFSFIGYTSQTISMESAQAGVVNITLQEDTSVLEDVVVVGYGVQRKSDITGSIAKVEAKQIQNAAVQNPVSAMQGQVAGVRITSNSGAPGGGISVRVRGVGTTNNSDPLYVVDGMPVSGIGYLGANDIESIEVLKDASASAIYGARGANGVILVTTKKGKAGSSNITFDSYYGIQKMNTDAGLLDGSQWYDYQESIGSDMSGIDRNVNTNWLEEVSRVAEIQSYNLSFNGGTEKSTYNVSLGYFDQEGVVKTSNYKKLTARLNGVYNVSERMTVGANIAISQGNKDKVNENSSYSGVIASAIKFDPVTPLTDADGYYIGSVAGTDYNNPAALIEYTDEQDKNTQLLGNIYGEYEIIEGLKFKTSAGTELNRKDGYSFVPVYHVSVNQNNAKSRIDRTYGKTDYWIWENTVNYTKDFDKHSISALAGYTSEYRRYESLGAGRTDLIRDTDNFRVINAGDNETATNYGSVTERAMTSILARINYGYDNRYLVTASVRKDGSSKFGPENRYGVFPSFSFGWRIINEEFMSSLKDSWLNNLKLRAGWGIIGNENILEYKYQALINSSHSRNDYLFGQPEEIDQGAYAQTLANPEIHWEETESMNLGIDFSILESRLSGSVDVYDKKTKDMLLSVSLPSYMGYVSSPVANIGKVSNKGLELGLNWKETRGDFTYSFGANMDFVKNEVVDMSYSDVLTGGSVRDFNGTRTEAGHPIASFYGYNVLGVYKTDADIEKYGYKNEDGTFVYQLGDPIIEDVNGDGSVDDEDYTYIGSYIPDFTYNINASLAYKGFDFSIQFLGVQGNEIYNGNKYYTEFSPDLTNKHKNVLDQWSTTNTDGNQPRYGASHVLESSSLYVEDGSFFRLKDVQLGYSLTQGTAEKIGLKGLRIYVNARNLFTITKYSGLDPEIGQYGSALTSGVDIGTYPISKTFTAGVNVSF